MVFARGLSLAEGWIMTFVIPCGSDFVTNDNCPIREKNGTIVARQETRQGKRPDRKNCPAGKEYSYGRKK